MACVLGSNPDMLLAIRVTLGQVTISEALFSHLQDEGIKLFTMEGCREDSVR